MRRWLKILNHLEEGALALTLLGLAVMAFVQVIFRYFFDISFTWFEELSRYLGVFLTFLGASLGVRYGTHFSMDFLLIRAGARAVRAMRLISALLGAAMFLTLAWLSWKHTGKMLRFGTLSGAMKAPMWLFYMPMPFFSLMIALRFLLLGWRQTRPEPAVAREGQSR